MNNGDSDFKEFIQALGWSKNKFYENLKHICSKEVYGIERSKFTRAGETKEDYFQGDKDFCFKERWKDLAYVLFRMFDENPFYRKNSIADSASLNTIIDYNKKYLKLIEEKVPDPLRWEIQLHPVYLATFIETKAMKIVSEKIQLFLSALSQKSIEERAQMWTKLNTLINWQLIESYLDTIEAKEIFDKEKGELFKNQLYGEYEHLSLDKYLARVLKNEMDEDFVKEREEIGRHYAEIDRESDQWFMDNCGDTTDEIEAVNKHFEALGLEEVVKQARKQIIEKDIEQRLIEAAKLVENGASIEKTIDEIISCLEMEKGERNVEKLKQLREVKEMLSKYTQGGEKFHSIADKILCELSYNIINRR